MHTIVESRWVARGKQGILRLMDVAIDQHQDGHFVIIIKSLIHIFDLDATNEMPSNQSLPINYPPPIMHFQCCPSNWINLPFFPRMASFCLLVCLLSGDDTLQEPTRFRSPFTSTGNIPLAELQNVNFYTGHFCPTKFTPRKSA